MLEKRVPNQLIFLHVFRHAAVKKFSLWNYESDLGILPKNLTGRKKAIWKNERHTSSNWGKHPRIYLRNSYIFYWFIFSIPDKRSRELQIEKGIWFVYVLTTYILISFLGSRFDRIFSRFTRIHCVEDVNYSSALRWSSWGTNGHRRSHIGLLAFIAVTILYCTRRDIPGISATSVYI